MDGQEKNESVKNPEQTGRKQAGSNEKRRSSGGGK